jgi:hypothetical protein
MGHVPADCSRNTSEIWRFSSAYRIKNRQTPRRLYYRAYDERFEPKADFDGCFNECIRVWLGSIGVLGHGCDWLVLKWSHDGGKHVRFFAERRWVDGEFRVREWCNEHSNVWR